MKNVIPRIMTMSAYGLNKYKNMMHSVNMCDIHCESFEELGDIVSEVLFSCECENCAVFMHSLDDRYYIAVIDEDENICNLLESSQRGDKDFFAYMDNELNLHCYGLLIETNNNEWRIIDA